MKTMGRASNKMFILVFPLVLAACALGEVSDSTPLPSITLAPPPAINLQGSCDDTKNLENWLQVTSQLTASFQTNMNEAATKSRNEVYDDVLDLAALRDSAFAVVTPDCAQEAELTLSDAMGQAVSAFQAFANGDAPDLGTTIVDVNNRLDQVISEQTSLLSRMNSQFQQQLQATSVP